jgi:DNA-binding IclR family transcriptional regulator
VLAEGEELMAFPTDKESAAVGPWLSGDVPVRFRSVKSAERTLAVFELFSLHQRPMGIGEIAKALSIPQPSVTMLVRNLTVLGYLEHDRESRNYSPTVRIMLLGSWIHRRFTGELDLERRIDALVRRLDETAMLGIQNRIYCQYVLVQAPADPNRLEVQSGMLRPLTTTAIGRVLLSLKPNSEIEAILLRCNAEVEEKRLRIRPDKFMEMINQIRIQGYARTAGDMVPGRAVIAINIPGALSKMPMAVGVGGTIERLARKERETLAALREFQAQMWK